MAASTPARAPHRAAPHRTARGPVLTGLALALALVAGGCGDRAGPQAPGGRPAALRLGYFPNLTHATALVGLERGVFQRHLGADVRLEARAVNAGPAAVEALFSGALDAAYIGPNPAINAHVRSGGRAIRIVSGATSGGALLVVRPAIDGPQDLRGATLATPQLGNTQDVALRTWLADHGLRTSLHGGEVEIVNQDNAQTLERFRAGELDGAWVPEPWATRLEREGGGKVLVDEASLWPGGRFVTTQLVVRTEFLTGHPELVERLVAGQVEATGLVNADPREAQRLANAGIERVTGKRLDPATIAAAWRRLRFTSDPLAPSLRASADRAVRLGLLEEARLDGIYDLGPLNRVLAGRGEGRVAA